MAHPKTEKAMGAYERLRQPNERQLSKERPGFGTQNGQGGGTKPAGPDVQPARSPLWNFEGIHKGSGWNAWSNTAVKHLRSEAAALENAGLYLYKSIRRTKLWRFQVGKLVAAKRITRHLKRAEALQMKAAQEIVAARRQYAATFGGKAKSSPSDFDPEA